MACSHRIDQAQSRKASSCKAPRLNYLAPIPFQMALPNPPRVVLKRLLDKGLGQLVSDLLREGKFMPGTLVGIDSHGNRYYEDKSQLFGQDRRVSYASSNPDASQIASEWHGWIHHMRETPPSKNDERKPWQLEHTENLTGTTDQYVPFSTTKPKIHPWTPPQRK